MLSLIPRLSNLERVMDADEEVCAMTSLFADEKYSRNRVDISLVYFHG